MATIPIEVIIQDAESPVTPTPESGGEINITVPDTGTISDVGSNSGGIGSSASTILPAIIAVLAIGAMVAMLVHKHRKHQNDKLSKKEKLATAASSTIAILAATVLVGNLVIPATKAATDETNSNSNKGTYLETEDKVTIVATIDKDSKEPTMVTVKDTLYATTDASGYTVTMSMIEDAITSNLYLNGDESSEYYIAPVEAEYKDESEDTTEGVELATNTWGYRLSEESGYLPVPIANNPTIVAEGEEAVTHEEINVYYGLKVDGTLPLGTYSGEIEYNITPINPIDKLTYMQDFAKLSAEEKTALIAAMPEGKQYILKDKRDEKLYYISKLADGNVWMTQNLDHDIVSTPNFYTYDNTDIGHGDTPDTTATWTGVATRAASDTTWDGSNTAPESYDPGKLYWDGNPTTQGGTIENKTVTDPSSAPGGIHYNIGNYYNWTAAVAMSNSSDYTADLTDVNQSICPAGWMLPKSSAALTDSGSFQYLTDHANLIAGTNGNIHIDPNYFVYGGKWGPAYDRGSVSFLGKYWSSVVNDDSASYIFSFFAYGSISPNNHESRELGYLVRCVARN